MASMQGRVRLENDLIEGEEMEGLLDDEKAILEDWEVEIARMREYSHARRRPSTRQVLIVSAVLVVAVGGGLLVRHRGSTQPNQQQDGMLAAPGGQSSHPPAALRRDDAVLGLYQNFPVDSWKGTRRGAARHATPRHATARHGAHAAGGLRLFLMTLRAVNSQCKVVIVCEETKITRDYQDVANLYNAELWPYPHTCTARRGAAAWHGTQVRRRDVRRRACEPSSAVRVRQDPDSTTVQASATHGHE